MRQIVLDTETTGLEPSEGHRIIEIGCVEMVDRRLTGNNFHYYLQPDRKIDAGAIKVHGITNEFLLDKPHFVDIAKGLFDFVRGSELIIHNAPFDTGFLNHEMKLLEGDYGAIEDYCQVTDTLVMARKMFPGQRNSLDALCKRYEIDNTHRTLHGALLDSEILAEVYLAMTGGQASLSLGNEDEEGADGTRVHTIRRLPADRPKIVVVRPTEEELAGHEHCLSLIDKKSDGVCLWLNNQQDPA
jgi:DNA polymerase-3 subunit epsilon